MLRKNQVAAVMPLVEMLNDRGIHLETYAETGLGELVIAANTQLDDMPPNDVPDILVEMTGSQNVVTEASPQEDGVVIFSNHSVAKRALVYTLAAGVKRVVSKAHTVIIPAIRDARDAIDKRIGETASVMAITPETRVFSYDDVWTSVTLDGIVTRHEGTPATIIPSSLQLPELTEEQVDALVSAGGTEMGSFVERYKRSHNVKQLYDAWFRGQTLNNPYATAVTTVNGGRSVDSVRNSLDNLLEFVDAPVIAYIMANNLLDNPPEGTVAASIEQYNLDISSALNHFGKVISLIYNQRDINARSGLLVMQFPNTINWETDGIRGELVLNADTYRGFLDNDHKGNIEAILGSMFSDSGSNNADTILSLAGQYKAVWENTLVKYKLTESERVRSAKMSALTTVVTDHIRNIPDEEWDAARPDIAKGDVIKQFVFWLSKDVPIPNTSVAMDEILITVFCDMIYPHYNAGEFIRRMNNYPNQNLEPKVIATYVIMEMVVSGLLSGVSYA